MNKQAVFDYTKCNRKYKQIGKFGTNKGICMCLTDKHQCMYDDVKCDAKTLKLLEDNKLSKIYKSFSKEYKIIVAEHNENYIKAQILGSQNAEKYARQFYHDDIEIYESFFIIILDTMKNTIGWVKISQGGTAGTVVDPKFVAKYSIDLMASAIVMVHNHPSGNFKPSNSDINLTKKIIEGLKLFDIAVLDHIIITKDSYLSFADEGLL